jgi:hypothetical protein
MTLPLKQDGTPDMRYAVSKKYRDFKVWQDPVIRQDCARLAEDIKKDIGDCLSSGKIKLAKKFVAKQTAEARAKLAGLDPSMLFFASGRLINHLNIYVEVGRAYHGT